MLRRASQALAFALSHSLASLAAPPLQPPLPILVLGQVSKSSTRDICQKMPRENWISFCFDLGRLYSSLSLNQLSFMPLDTLFLPRPISLSKCAFVKAKWHMAIVWLLKNKQTNG